jgi:hypothetical protein
MGDAPDMGSGNMGDIGGPGDDTIMMGGAEGSMPTTDMGSDPNAPMESRYNNKPLINEQSNKLDVMFNKYLSTLTERKETQKETEFKRADIYDSDFLLINEEFDKMIGALGKFTEEKDEE